MRATPVIVSAVAAATLALAPAAQADFDGPAYAFPVPDYVSGLVGANTLGPISGSSGRGSSGKRGKQARAPKQATGRQLRALRFKRRASISNRVFARVAATVEPADPSAFRRDVEAAQRAYRTILSQSLHGSSTDLADQVAMSIVQSYATYYAKTKLSSRTLRAVRRQVRSAVGLQKSARRLSDARQQETSEILELRQIFAADAIGDARRAGDADAADGFLEDMRSFTEETVGVDVKKIRLSGKGIRAR